MANQEDVLSVRESLQVALDIAGLLVEHQAEDTVVLDVNQQSGWTDYFVIATTRNYAHLRGLLRHVGAQLRQAGNILGRGHAGHSLRRAPDESGWVLVDIGDVVIHLMTSEQRSFYELERVWFRSPVVFRDGGSPEGPEAFS